MKLLYGRGKVLISDNIGLMAEYPEDISNFPERMRKNYTHLKKYRGKQYKPSRITGTSRATRRTSRATTRTGAY